jgi:5-methylcytosine-specific restriction endonuclease McrA
MSLPPPSAAEQVRFLQQLQRILSDGGFVATYKFALLHALADLAVVRGDDSGDELPLKTREISEQLIELYWRQAAPFPASTPAVLSQNAGRQAAIVTRLAAARERYGATLGRLRQNAGAWRTLVTQVDRTLCEMPLWKLQTVGREKLDFLYDNVGAGDRIILKPGVAYCFRTFYDLILDLVRGAWLRFVRSRNLAVLGSTVDLSAFLFGTERSGLGLYHPILMEVQRGECFYCGGRLQSGVAVDHFIPWSRYPIDLGHNFVLAHKSCNSSKADHLAAERHLERWLSRNEAYGTELEARFSAGAILHDAQASHAVAHWAYGTADRLGSLVWLKPTLLEKLSPHWRQLFTFAALS